MNPKGVITVDEVLEELLHSYSDDGQLEQLENQVYNLTKVVRLLVAANGLSAEQLYKSGSKLGYFGYNFDKEVEKRGFYERS